MGDAVPPALAHDKAAIVCHAAQITRACLGEIVQLEIRQERLDPVGACDFGQRKRCKRAAKTWLVVGLGDDRRQLFGGMTQALRLQMLAAQSLRP